MGSPCRSLWRRAGLIGLIAFMVLAFWGIAQNARADYWARHTRESSGNTLPQYFELENMTKSSLGVRFLYGTDRKTMAGVGTDTKNLISYDGTSWTEQSETARTASGYSEIQFMAMYADTNGNIWMPNRSDPNRPLLKYNGATKGFERISPDTISQQAGVGNGLRVNNLFTGPNNNIYAVAADPDGHMYIVYYDGTWHDSGITGGPLADYGSDMDIFGTYSSANGGSYWLYKHQSSENEFTTGMDVGPGIWKYASSNWTQYDHDNTNIITSNGANFVNGVTEAFADSAGKVWVGSRHGVFMYDGVNWVNWTKDNNNIFTNRVIKIQEDSNGRIWIICLENENAADDKGGVSIYTPGDGSWDYYTSYNGENAIDNATNIFMVGQGGDEAWMFTGHGEVAMSAGIYVLTRDDAHTAIYGQTSGTIVDKAGLFDQAKKKKSTDLNKAVTIYKLTKKNKKWKKSQRVYKGNASQWYKVLSLDIGRYKVESKAKGKKKKTKTINITSGDPYRLDLK